MKLLEAEADQRQRKKKKTQVKLNNIGEYCDLNLRKTLGFRFYNFFVFFFNFFFKLTALFTRGCRFWILLNSSTLPSSTSSFSSHVASS